MLIFILGEALVGIVLLLIGSGAPPGVKAAIEGR
jgi:hypothetical protein